MPPIKGGDGIVESGSEFIMHTGHGAKGLLTKVGRGDVDTLNICIFVNLRAEYVHTQNTRKTPKDRRPRVEHPHPTAGA